MDRKIHDRKILSPALSRHRELCRFKFQCHISDSVEKLNLSFYTIQHQDDVGINVVTTIYSIVNKLRKF